MAEKTQTSFTGGIMSPSLLGRAEIGRYDHSVQDMQNFFLQSYGGAIKRAGTKYLDNTKSDNKARLIPFSFNDEQTYILEFTDTVMKVYTLGAVVAAYELATPYLEADLFTLEYVQSADVMTIVHPSYAPRELVRLADNNWTLTAIDFDPEIDPPDNLTATPSSSTGYEYTWGVSAIDNTTGEESLIEEVVSAVAIQLTQANVDAGAYCDLAWDAVANASNYYVYRKESGTGGIYGYVGASDTNKARDETVTPDFFITPQEQFTELSGADNLPSAVAYFQQRLVFGGTNNDPQKLWFSQVGNFHNFNSSFPIRDDDSMSFVLNAEEVNRIRHLQGIRGGLLCLTSGDEFVITGGGGFNTPITPTSIFANSQTRRGASPIKPVRVGDSVLYVQSRGSYVRNFNFSIESDGYSGDDMTVFSNHLFRGYQIIQWNYQQIFDSIIWAVRSDGKLLSFTYVPEQQVWGWSIHSTDGEYESVAVIAGDDVDEVYVSVKRTLNGVDYRFVELLQDSSPEDAREAFFVDSGLSYNDPKTITGITQADPGVFSIASHGFSNGAIVSITDVVGMTDVNKKYYQVLNAAANSFEIGDRYSGDPVDTSGFGEYIEGGYARECVDTITGLDHLPDGTIVDVLADGNVLKNNTVSSGSVTLSSVYGQIHAGLPYTAFINTLPLAMLGGRTARGKEKVVVDVVVQLLNSRGLEVGPNADSLRPMKERAQEGWDEEIELQTGEPTIAINPDWNRKGSVYINCPDPLPAQILSLTPDVDVSD